MLSPQASRQPASEVAVTPHEADYTYGGAAARRSRIVGIIQQRGFSTVAELSEVLGVSQMTVRRDLHRLAEEGLIRSVHGGASTTLQIGAVDNAASRIGDFGLRASRQVEAKRAVAQRAAQLVEPQSVVALDAGTTVCELAAALPTDLSATVVTHSLPALDVLANHKDVQLIGLGGLFHPETQAFAGPTALAELRQLRIQIAFLGASSIHDGALYCGNPLDAEMKAALIERSDRTILVCDASKFDVSALIPVAPLTAIHSIVIDDIRDGDRQMLADANVQVIQAQPERVPA